MSNLALGAIPKQQQPLSQLSGKDVLLVSGFLYAETEQKVPTIIATYNLCTVCVKMPFWLVNEVAYTIHMGIMSSRLFFTEV